VVLAARSALGQRAQQLLPASASASGARPASAAWMYLRQFMLAREIRILFPGANV
jgi:hypothetical protein